MKKLLLVVSLFLLLPFLQTSIANAFELEGFDGSKINLDDKIGQDKWTLVMFWAHNCHVCKEETPVISDFHDKRDDVEVIGISIDGQEKKELAEQFLESANPSFPSYLSSFLMVSSNYQILTEEDFRGTPTFLLFTPDGELLGNNPGKLSIESLENFIDRNS